jgi:hypothetical protein
MSAKLITAKEPSIGLEPMTARLQIECSTTELARRLGDHNS